MHIYHSVCATRVTVHTGVVMAARCWGPREHNCYSVKWGVGISWKQSVKGCFHLGVSASLPELNADGNRGKQRETRQDSPQTAAARTRPDKPESCPKRRPEGKGRVLTAERVWAAAGGVEEVYAPGEPLQVGGPWVSEPPRPKPHPPRRVHSKWRISSDAWPQQVTQESL